MDFILPTTVKECNCIQTTLWNPWSLGGEKQARELLKQINRIEMEERLRLPMGAKEQEKANVVSQAPQIVNNRLKIQYKSYDCCNSKQYCNPHDPFHRRIIYAPSIHVHDEYQ